MKILPTIMTAAFIAGSCTVAMAQAGGDVNPNKGPTRGSDQNPTATTAPTGAMRTAPVSGTPRGNDATTNSSHDAQGSETGSARDSAGPAGERAVPGSGGSK